MYNVTFEPERAAIRFAIDGDSTCDEFGEFLRDTVDVYHLAPARSLYFETRLLRRHAPMHAPGRNNQWDQRTYSWHHEVFGRLLPGREGHFVGPPPPPYEKLIEVTRSITGPLQVDAISYASPGWIQLIGNWHPLKVLADFISKWRAENTKRIANERKYEIDRLRIQADFAAKLLEAAPKMEPHYEGGTERLIDMEETVRVPTPATWVASRRTGASSLLRSSILESPFRHLTQSRTERPRPHRVDSGLGLRREPTGARAIRRLGRRSRAALNGAAPPQRSLPLWLR